MEEILVPVGRPPFDAGLLDACLADFLCRSEGGGGD